jgi:hypothetical protein
MKYGLIMVISLCFCGMVMGQEQPTPPNSQPQQQIQVEQQEYTPLLVPGPVVNTPVWVIQRKWLGFRKYKVKPGWVAPSVLVAPAPPIITQQILVPQTVTQQVMVPQTVTQQVMVPQIITRQVMVPVQVQRVPQPVITWSPQVQWRY